MQGEGWRAITHRALGFVEWLAVFSGALFAAVLKAPPVPNDPAPRGLETLWAWFLEQTQPNAWWLVPAATVLTVASHGCRRVIGAPWLWDVVNDALNTLQKELFGHHTSAPDHRHRVTLFRYRRLALRPCYWPMSGWLIPVARSGYSTRNTWTMFRVPREPTHARGVAGMTFRHRGTLYIPPPGQKPMPAVGPGAAHDKIASYAERTFVDAKWVRKRLRKRPEILPRSYVGIPIDVKGRPWGALVIDSADPAVDQESVEKAFRLVGGTLSKLLQGVS